MCIGVLYIAEDDGLLKSGSYKTRTFYYKVTPVNQTPENILGYEEMKTGEYEQAQNILGFNVSQICNRVIVWNESLSSSLLEFGVKKNPGYISSIDQSGQVVYQDSYTPLTDMYSNNSYQEPTYAQGGRVIANANNYSNYGKSFAILGLYTSISEKLETNKTSYDIGLGETIVPLYVQPSTMVNEEVIEGNSAYSSTTNLELKVILPKGITYINNSSYYGGTYNKETKEVENGNSITPDIFINDEGVTTVKWLLSDVKYNEALDKLHYKVEIAPYVKAGTNITIKSYISSPEDSRDVSENTSNPVRFSSAGFTVTVTAGTRLYEVNKQSMIDVGEDMTYEITFENPSNIVDYDKVSLYSMLPFNGDYRNTNFNGTYKVSAVTQALLQGKITGAALYYTLDESIKTAKNEEDFMDKVMDLDESSWVAIGTKIASQNGVTNPEALCEDIPDNVVAFRIVYDNVGLDTITKVGITLTPENNKPYDVYGSSSSITAENWLDNANINTSTCNMSVLARTLSGLVFIDGNHDGIRNNDLDVLVKNAVVTLEKEENGVWEKPKDINEKEIESIITTENGQYSFTNLKAGTYRVRIAYTELPFMKPTYINRYDDKEIDSNCSEELLGEEVVIENLIMPLSRNILVMDYKDNYEDAGIYFPGTITVNKTLTGINGTNINPEPEFEVALFNESDNTQIASGKLKWNSETNQYDSVVFNNLSIGNYYVKEVDQRKISIGNNGIYYQKDNETGKYYGKYVVSIGSEVVTIGLNNDSKQINISNRYTKTARITGTAWLDGNKNGIREVSEILLQGFTVSLTDLEGNPATDVAGKEIAAVTTDANGYYEFSNLQCGEKYKVVFTDGTLKMSDYAITKKDAGEDNVDSDALGVKNAFLDSAYIEITNLPSANIQKENIFVSEYNDAGFYLMEYSTEAKITVNKEIIGDIPEENKIFNFEITPITQNAPMPENTKDNKVILSLTGAGSVDSSTITFTQSGTYEYKVIEISETVEGYVYDNSQYKIIFSVSINNKGVMVAQPVIYKNDVQADNIIFSNRYVKSTETTDTSTAEITTSSNKINTGDGTNTKLLIIALLFAVCGLGVLTVFGIKNKKNRNS